MMTGYEIIIVLSPAKTNIIHYLGPRHDCVRLLTSTFHIM